MAKVERVARFWSCLGALVGVTAWIGACQTQEMSDTSGSGGEVPGSSGGSAPCGAGVAGCACETSGATVDCGHVVTRSGDYVTCSEGRSTCQSGTWGVCVGNNIVTKSLGGATINSNGLKVLGTTTACTDPCDPNSCLQSTQTSADVDASNVAVGPQGVTIPPSISTTGGVEGGTGDGATCRGLQCAVQYCSNNPTNGTTVTGKVFDPAGTNPLYNAWVYVPVDSTAPLPPFTQGVTCDTCAGTGSMNAVAVAQTAYDGTFTLTNVPSGVAIPIVVQMGKWRRKVTLPAILPCQNTAVSDGTLRLPRNQTDGDGNAADIPRIAFMSGSADPFECMLVKAGIDPNEFGSTTLNSNRRIMYFNSPDSAGASIDSSYGNVVKADTLWNSSANLSLYDLIILACEGGEYTSDRSANGFANLGSYAGLGGRVFLSHFSYVWMKYYSPWQALSPFWGPVVRQNYNTTQDPLTSTVVTSGFSKGQAFQQWLYAIGASTTLGSIDLHEARQDITTPLATAAQPWLSTTNNAGASSLSGGSGFHVTNGSKTVTASSGNFQNEVSVGAAIKFSAQSTTSYIVASIASNSSLTLTTAYTGSTSTSSSATAQMNPATFNPSFTFNAPITSPAASQCGRVVFSDFHVSTSAVDTGSNGTVSCATNADCGYGSTCTPPVYGTCGCNEDGDCATMSAGTCNGESAGSCGTATCFANSDCSSGNGTCAGAVKGTCGCNEDSDCTTLGAGTCNGESAGSCGTATCFANSDCSSGNGTCSGEVAGTCGTATCYSNSDCTAGPDSCNGGTDGTCGCSYDSDCAALGAGTCTNETPGTCPSATCLQNSDCSAGSGTCIGASSFQCSCTKNSDCATGHTCSGGFCTSSACGASGSTVCKASASSTCKPTVKGNCGCFKSTECITMLAGLTCNNAVTGQCSAKTCTSNLNCALAGTGSCSNAVKGHCGCFKGTDCTAMSAGSTCSGATKGKCGCYKGSECTAMSAGSTCSGAVTGQCSTATCTAGSACTAAGTGTCSGATHGKCGCYKGAECTAMGAGNTCSGAVTGSCSTPTCTASSGCSTGTKVCTGGVASTCTGNAKNFPYECIQAPLSPQEAALEFALFDLSACVSPDTAPPPAPPSVTTVYNPVSFHVDFAGSCPSGTHVVWRQFEWNDNIPSTASIVYSAQTVDSPADGAAPDYSSAQVIPVYTATTSTAAAPPDGGAAWDVALLDTSSSAGPGTGAFSKVTPVAVSKNNLRITVTLNPTSDMKGAPLLSQWQVQSDCMPSE